MVIKFSSSFFYMIVSNQFLFSQEMCPPSNLLSSSGDRSIFYHGGMSMIVQR